jgi:hypothetical protein
MAWRLRTPQGKQLYGLRKQTPERVFGIIKSVMGFRQFLLRGLDRVRPMAGTSAGSRLRWVSFALNSAAEVTMMQLRERAAPAARDGWKRWLAARLLARLLDLGLPRRSELAPKIAWSSRFRAIESSGAMGLAPVARNEAIVGSRQLCGVRRSRAFAQREDAGAFEALASTSAGFAWSIGPPDYGLPRSEVFNPTSPTEAGG